MSIVRILPSSSVTRKLIACLEKKQVRDEARATNDPARGGMGGLAIAEMAYGPLQGGSDWQGDSGGGGYKRPRVDWDARNSRR